MTDLSLLPDIAPGTDSGDGPHVDVTAEQVVGAAVASIKRAFGAPERGYSETRSALCELVRRTTQGVAPEIVREIVAGSTWLLNTLATELGRQAAAADVAPSNTQIEFDVLLRGLTIVAERVGGALRHESVLVQNIAAALIDHIPSHPGYFRRAFGQSFMHGSTLAEAVLRRLEEKDDGALARDIRASLPGATRRQYLLDWHATQMYAAASALAVFAVRVAPARAVRVLVESERDIDNIADYLAGRAIENKISRLTEFPDDQLVFNRIVAHLTAAAQKAAADPVQGPAAAQAVARTLAQAVVRRVPAQEGAGRFVDAFAQAASSGHGRGLADAVVAELKKSGRAAQADAIRAALAGTG